MAEYEIKYRFPASLGGGLYKEYRHMSGGTEAPIGTVAFLIDNALICIARTLLTEELELQEPPERGIVLDRDGAAWQRNGDWWVCAARGWGRERDLDWDKLKESAGPLTLLVPRKF